MPRYKLLVEYDGTPYAGWQRQSGAHTIQQAIETAITGFSGETVTVRGAGRTDAGVHAAGQVAHFDLRRVWQPDKVHNALNAHLAMAGERVSILDVQAVSDDFDARFSATRRHYRYVIINRRAPLTFELNRAWRVSRKLDADAMGAAAQALVGEHDFTTFRSAHCQARSPMKTMEVLDVVRDGERIEIHATARSFLHNQIRSIAGSLEKVGEGTWQVDDISKALRARDRAACGPVAPPEGLYLMRVDYDER
jgi:tRNA pseudouridine38-40 synthase